MNIYIGDIIVSHLFRLLDIVTFTFFFFFFITVSIYERLFDDDDESYLYMYILFFKTENDYQSYSCSMNIQRQLSIFFFQNLFFKNKLSCQQSNCLIKIKLKFIYNRREQKKEIGGK